MTPKEPPQGFEWVTPQKTLEDIMAENARAGDASQKAVLQHRADSGSKAMSAIAESGTSPDGEEKIEGGDGKIVSFSRAAEILKSAGFDLEKAREEAVRLHSQLGLVKALQARGVVSGDDRYGALFDNVEFTTEGIRQVADDIRKGERREVVFNPGLFTYKGLWKVLIDGNKVPYSPDYGYAVLNAVRQVHPEYFKYQYPLHALPKMNWFEKADAFCEAYKLALPPPVGGPKVSFTTDRILEPDRDLNTIDCMQEIDRGAKFLDAEDDLIRWITEVKTTGQYPGHMENTIYPDRIVPHGAVLCMAWSTVYDSLTLDLQHVSRRSEDMQSGMFGQIRFTMGPKRAWR